MVANSSKGSSNAYVKRIPKACDRCRFKKVRCDGQMPCYRCRADQVVCHFNICREKRERHLTPSHVFELELQQHLLIDALKTTWRRYGPAELQAQQGGDVKVHDIIKALGLLEDAWGHRRISTDFQFDETLASSTWTAKAKAISSLFEPELHKETKEARLHYSPASPRDTDSSCGSQGSRLSSPSLSQSLPESAISIPVEDLVQDICPDAGAAPGNDNVGDLNYFQFNPFSTTPSPLNFPSTMEGSYPTPATSGFSPTNPNPSVSNPMPQDTLMNTSMDGFLWDGMSQFNDETWKRWFIEQIQYDMLSQELADWLSLRPRGCFGDLQAISPLRL